jgi:electron transfer flavoprotein alpha subunit
MKILAFAEQREGKFKKTAFEITKAAKNISESLDAELLSLVIGNEVENMAAELGGYGATQVIVVEDPRLKYYSATAFSKIVSEIAQKESVSLILLPASQLGKDLAPRIAVKLDAGLATDCTAVKIEGNEIIATRPIFAGKVLSDVKITSSVKIFTLRPNVFTSGKSSGAKVSVQKVSVDINDSDFKVKGLGTKVSIGRPDVTEASIIVSGGRGMKSPENFQMLEALAETLGAAVGASRAAVDAGWRPHDEQVGQTGKTVSPNLYIACGISGAIQHLAGMSSSKYIVAINKDKDAPIFQIADYGIVADATEILPALNMEIKTLLGK